MLQWGDMTLETLMDSGAAIHVVPIYLARDCREAWKPSKLKIFGAGGHQLRNYGEIVIKGKLLGATSARRESVQQGEYLKPLTLEDMEELREVVARPVPSGVLPRRRIRRSIRYCTYHF